MKGPSGEHHASQQPSVRAGRSRAVVGRVELPVNLSRVSRVRVWDKARWRARTTSASAISCCWTRLRSIAWWRIWRRGGYARRRGRRWGSRTRWQMNGWGEGRARARAHAPRVPFAVGDGGPRTLFGSSRRPREGVACVSAGVGDGFHL